MGIVQSSYEQMNETHLSVFHSISNRTRVKRSRNSISSAARYAFNTSTTQITLLKHKHMNIINEERGVFTVSSCVQAQVLHAIPDQFRKLLPFRAA